MNDLTGIVDESTHAPCGSAIAQARAAWDNDLPDWVEALAHERDRTSQSQVAKLINYTSAVVSQVIHNKYKADTGAVEQAVRGALMNATVECPVVGELPAHECLEHQKRPYTPVNPIWIRLFRACNNGCPHNRNFQRGDQ